MAKRWMPMQRATWQPDHPKSHAVTDAVMKIYNVDRPAAEKIIRDGDAPEVWRNDLYQVAVRRFHVAEWANSEVAHLNIRRVDGAAMFDWRHQQRIKNDIVGPECEGLMLFPAEERLVDSSNKYHVFVFTDPLIRVPLGWTTRDVIDDEIRSPPGMRQRRNLDRQEQ